MISFIIPAYNEEKFIEHTIRSIREACSCIDEPIEIVVADDNSSDRTAAVAESVMARVVRVANRQISATRNAGARASIGEFLIFVDADTSVSPGAVIGALNAMQNGAAGGGCAIRFDGEIPLYARALLPVMLLLYRTFKIASGCFLFCTRNTFNATGGFDERVFAAEEALMSRAIGKQGRFVVLRETVITSGRKLRAYPPGVMLSTLLRLTFRPGAMKRRDGLELWYADSHKEPDPSMLENKESGLHVQPLEEAIANEE